MTSAQIFNLKIILSFFVLSAIAQNFILVDALGILSDVEKVERLVVDFSIAKSWMKQIMGLSTQTLCDFPIEMKLYLCQLYFKEDVYDFDYSWPSNLKNEALKCAYEEYSLRILDENLLKSRTRSMYKCPSTNEGEFLGQRSSTYIARSRIENSALVFTRRNRSSPLYPHRYIDGFTFQQLFAEMSSSPLKFGYSILREPLLRMTYSNLPSTYEFSLPSSPLRVIDRQSTTEGHAYQSAKLKQLETYEKFRKLYRVVPICSLTNTEKLIFCELVRIKTFVNDIDFEFDENQPLRCEKQTISYKTKPDVEGLEKRAVPLVRCPVVVIAGEDDFYERIRTIYSPHQIFISNCFQPNCLVVYGRRTHHGDTQPKINSIQADLPIKAILKESKAISRKLIYPANDLETQKSLPTSLSHYKYKLADYRAAYQFDQHLSRAEKEVIDLFEIVKLTSPYEKFRKTLKKFNICELSRKRKIEYCIRTYENQLYKYKIDLTDQPDTDMQCRRSEILLNDFEGKQNLALIQCPIVELEVFEGQYLSGGVEERTVILYSRSKLYV